MLKERRKETGRIMTNGEKGGKGIVDRVLICSEERLRSRRRGKMRVRWPVLVSVGCSEDALRAWFASSGRERR